MAASHATDTSETQAELRYWDFAVVPAQDDPLRTCWGWSGPKTKKGYAYFTHKDRLVYAHRFSHELQVGPIPPGFEVDHVKARGCAHRDCSNPGHLEAVTPRENTRRSDSTAGRNARKTTCNRGHPLAGDNLYVRANGNRECRACKRLARPPKKPRREACRRGHALSPENTHITATGERVCRACARERVRAHRARRRAA